MTTPETWHEHEQAAGAPLTEPVPLEQIAARREATYRSYEQYLRRKLDELDAQRSRQWQRDYTSRQAYQASVEPMRRRLEAMLGFWVPPRKRPPVQVLDRQRLGRRDDCEIYRFHFEFLPGVTSYGLELKPPGRGPRPGLIVQHGYGASPELACGLSQNANTDDWSYRSLGLRAVRRGFHVIAVHHPSGYGKLAEVVTTVPQPADQTDNYGKNRLHRLATLAGGTLFGLDLMATSRAVDLLEQTEGVAPQCIGMYGLSQGGQTALFLPALDTRLRASVCSAYFNLRKNKLIGPCRGLSYLDSHEEDKFFTDVIGCFADSDLVSLIAPRAFAVEAGERDLAVDFEAASAAFQHAREHYDRLGLGERIVFVAHRGGHVAATARALDFLQAQLTVDSAAG